MYNPMNKLCKIYSLTVCEVTEDIKTFTMTFFTITLFM